MDAKPLSTAEKKELRALPSDSSHVTLGKQGLTDTVLAEIETALTKNGLIKVRFDADRTTIRTYTDAIPSKLGCEYVGGVGKVAIFFRDMPEDS